MSTPAELGSVDIEAIRSALAVEGGTPEKKRAVISKVEVDEAEKRAFARGYEKGVADGRYGALKDVERAIAELTPSMNERREPTSMQGAKVPMPGRMDKPRAVAAVLNDGVTSPQQRILDAMAKLEALGLSDLHKVQVAAVAGVSPNSGSYANNLGRLRTMALIDYPQGGLVAFTKAGRKAARQVNVTPTLSDLHEAWYSIVTQPQQRILREIIAAYPESLSKEKLAKRIGVSPDSGSYANNLGRLRTLGAIDYPRPGNVKAMDVLFPKRQAA